MNQRDGDMQIFFFFKLFHLLSIGISIMVCVPTKSGMSKSSWPT